MFGYSGQLNTCYVALVAQGSPAELKKPVNIDRQKVS